MLAIIHCLQLLDQNIFLTKPYPHIINGVNGMRESPISTKSETYLIFAIGDIMFYFVIK